MRKPRRSKRPISSATRPRRTASGLSRTRVVSVGIALPAVGGSGLGFVQRHRALLLAWAWAPRSTGTAATRGRSARATALAGQLEPARAVRAGDEVGLDIAAAARAHALLAEPALHRADLELALAHVVEVLRRAQDQYTSAPTNGNTKRGHDRRRRRARDRRCGAWSPCTSRTRARARARRRRTARAARSRGTCSSRRSRKRHPTGCRTTSRRGADWSAFGSIVRAAGCESSRRSPSRARSRWRRRPRS